MCRRLPRSSDLDLRGDEESARGVLCPQDLPQSSVVSVMDRGIEQRPWLGAGQQRGPGGGALIGPHAVAYRGEIGDQIAPIRRRQTEIEHAVEMDHHLIVAVIAAV